MEEQFDFIGSLEIRTTPHDQIHTTGCVRKPLLISCSGGGGHIAAMKAILSMFRPEELEMYLPVPYASKPYSRGGFLVCAGILFHSLPLVGRLSDRLSFPILPHGTQLDTGIKQLESKDARPYMDMLLDAYPAGYENVALWNFYQRHDATQELAKLVALQSHHDQMHASIVYDGFLRVLNRAFHGHKPFTEVISTQAQGLGALCDVVAQYNRQHGASLVIHQYMTDLPTQGAIHYFNALAQLAPMQQRQMKLYAVGMSLSVMRHFFRAGHAFQGVYNIDPKNNPMIRPGFTNPVYDYSDKFEEDITLCLQGLPAQLIRANEKIASIMLGSQAGMDSTKYISALIYNGMDKVFVFAGSNKKLSDEIEALSLCYDFIGKIIELPNQEDISIASIMTRSNVLITRAGGLSVMEHLAMNHHKEQIILVHHTDLASDVMTSGISWEDGNCDVLFEQMGKQGIQVLKTSPSRVDKQLKALLFPDSKASEDWHDQDEDDTEELTREWQMYNSV